MPDRSPVGNELEMDGFSKCPFFGKIRKTPDFISKSGVFMVAEGGLELANAGHQRNSVHPKNLDTQGKNQLFDFS